MRFFECEEQKHQERQAFYANAEPCESCGTPCFTARVWNEEYQLWMGTECSCNIPESPICSVLELLIAQPVTAGEVCDMFRKHAATCSKCKVPTVQPEAGPITFKEAA